MYVQMCLMLFKSVDYICKQNLKFELFLPEGIIV